MQRIAPNNGVYMLEFPNGKRYIGVVASSTNTVAKRWAVYKRLKCTQQPLLYRALLKYGVENVKFSMLVSEGTHEELWEAERRLIAEFKTQDSEFGYNIAAGGKGGRTGVPATEATKAKMRARFLGQPTTAESKEKNRQAHLGRKASPEARERMRLAQAKIRAEGRGPKSRTQTAETRAKISASSRGRKVSAEALVNMKKAQELRRSLNPAAEALAQSERAKLTWSLLTPEEHAARCAKAKEASRIRYLTHQVSAETRAKMSASAKAARAARKAVA